MIDTLRNFSRIGATDGMPEREAKGIFGPG
jgi:hypothetical protein